MSNAQTGTLFKPIRKPDGRSIGKNRLIIGLVKRVHVREELIDRQTPRIRDERFHVIGRMASPNWYCRTRDRFEMVRPK